MNKFLTKVVGVISAATMLFSTSMFVSANDANTLTLNDNQSVAGKLVTVDLSMNTNNLCAGYNLDIEFDERLELKNVEGVMTTCTIDNVVSIVNFTGTSFKDGKVLSTLTFKIPDDAATGSEYNVSIKNITNFCTDCEEFENVVINNSTITVLEGGEKEVSNHMVYVEEGSTTSTQVSLRGDVNSDNKVDLYDAILVAKQTMNLETFDKKQSFFGNVNEDDTLNLYDIIGICRYSMSNNKENAWGEIIKI